MKIVITGIAGFLGSHLAEMMREDGHEVVGIDNLIGGDPLNVPSGIHWIEADCNNINMMKVLCKDADVVYHCAATAYEGLSVFSPHIVITNIVGAATSVFSAAIAKGVKRIVHCSSMARYGAAPPPFREHYDCKPQDPYGIGKVAAEQLLVNLCKTHKVDYTIAVPHNIYGPKQKYDDPFRNVAAIFINNMLQNKSPIVYGTGQQQRCFSYIDDCLSCLYKMAFSSDVVGQVINIGPDENPITIQGLYDTVAGITGHNEPPRFLPDRPREVKLAWCSSDKARQMLNYWTQTTLEEGLNRQVEFIRARGTKPFKYHLPLEIVSDITPKTWTEKLY